MVCSGCGSLLTARRVFEVIQDPDVLQATHSLITPARTEISRPRVIFLDARVRRKPASLLARADEGIE
jgi:hypothetical protein